MIIDGDATAEDSAKSTCLNHIADAQASSTMMNSPPPYTYPQHLAPVRPVLPTSSQHTTMPHQFPSATTPTAAPPYHSPQSRLYPHSVLRVTTTRYDFRNTTGNEHSSLLPSSPSTQSSHSHSDCSRPASRALKRFFRSFIVALGILFLWLILVQSIRFFVFGGELPFWGRPPHHVPPHRRPRWGGGGGFERHRPHPTPVSLVGSHPPKSRIILI